jgi:hypothetical protein
MRARKLNKRISAEGKIYFYKKDENNFVIRYYKVVNNLLYFCDRNVDNHGDVPYYVWNLSGYLPSDMISRKIKPMKDEEIVKFKMEYDLE